MKRHKQAYQKADLEGKEEDGATFFFQGDSTGEDSGDELELRLRGSGTGKAAPDNSTEIELQPGDTLASIALKYNCTAWELKQLNGIHHSNEIHALRMVRVPLRHTLLVDLAAVPVARPVSISAAYKDSESGDARRFLTHMDQDLQALRLKAASQLQKSSLEEVAASLTCKRFHSMDIGNGGQVRSYCSGADWGINWWKLLMCGFALLVLGPLVYFFYMATDAKEEQARRDNSTESVGEER